MEGKVKFFKSSEGERKRGCGYGFIIDNETGQEYFVHDTNTLDNLKKDDLVVFDPERGERGLKAVNVRRKKNVNNQTG